MKLAQDASRVSLVCSGSRSKVTWWNELLRHWRSILYIPIKSMATSTLQLRTKFENTRRFLRHSQYMSSWRTGDRGAYWVTVLPESEPEFNISRQQKRLSGTVDCFVGGFCAEKLLGRKLNLYRTDVRNKSQLQQTNPRDVLLLAHSAVYNVINWQPLSVDCWQHLQQSTGRGEIFLSPGEKSQRKWRTSRANHCAKIELDPFSGFNTIPACDGHKYRLTANTAL